MAALVILVIAANGGAEDAGQEDETATVETSIPTPGVEVTTTTTTERPTTTEAPPTTTTTTTTSAPPRLTVTRVIDGDTVDLSDGSTVRLIGIDTPERGVCGYGEAAERLRQLVEGKAVTLVPGARDDRDRYGRLLRYIEVDGLDVDLEMIRGGHARARYDSRDGYGRHPREDAYVAADASNPPTPGCAASQPPTAPTARPQVTGPPAVPSGSGCHPSYVGACVPAGVEDVDCAGGKGNGPEYVTGPIRVVGPDEYGLDGNKDGMACE